MRSTTFLLVFISSFLTACGGSETQGTSPPSVVPTPNAPVTQAPDTSTSPPVSPAPDGPASLSSKDLASSELKERLMANSQGLGLSAFTMPASDDYENIPQDPNNPLSAEKVALGKFLFHDTALATAGMNQERSGTWSCASCHHADAGFKSGIKQGIGEGGEGFANGGAMRKMAEQFSTESSDPTLVPDVQPLASPTILNTAYQEAMLWNGQFGNGVDGIINAGLDMNILASQDTPKAENMRQLSGLEIQAVAGIGVHRLDVENASVLQTNATYVQMLSTAFPNSDGDVKADAGKAIAAYERTVLANQSGFQRWLKGDEDAMSEQELRGANVFFGKANCSACHTGPALSSSVGASADEVFFAVGFADFAEDDSAIEGRVDEATSKGRGGFTQRVEDNYKFKIASLYNLADTNVFGHGASFSSIREVVEYKNRAIPQKDIPASQLDYRFLPLGLNSADVDDLVVFLESALYDPNLQRYVPDELPSGACIVVADEQSMQDLDCDKRP